MAVTAAVDERDLECCKRCGIYVDGGSRHHRKLRRFGDHSAANLVLLCGSGTTACHGYVHANPASSYKDGWLVHSWHAPEDVPLYDRSRCSWVLLDRTGSQTMITPEDALARRTELGLI